MSSMANYSPKHFSWRMDGRIAIVSLLGAARKNPLTFDSYAELRDTFRALVYADDVDVVIFASNEGNFCSGGDVHDIIAAADQDGHEGTVGVYTHDRRSGQGDDPLRQADHQRSRRNLRRRGCNYRDGIGPAPWRRRWQKPRFCSPASGLPVATWALAPCCRASSGRAGPPNLLYTGRTMSADGGRTLGLFQSPDRSSRNLEKQR